MTYRMKRYGILGILLIILTAVTVAWEMVSYEQKQYEGDCMESLRFVIDNRFSEQVIRCFTDESGQTDYLFLPSYANADDVKIHFEGAEKVIFCRGEEEILLKSGEDIGALLYDEPYDIRFYNKADGELGQKTMIIMHSANLPAAFLTTESGSMELVDADKNYEEKGQICVFDVGGV